MTSLARCSRGLAWAAIEAWHGLLKGLSNCSSLQMRQLLYWERRIEIEFRMQCPQANCQKKLVGILLARISNVGAFRQLEDHTLLDQNTLGTEPLLHVVLVLL